MVININRVYTRGGDAGQTSLVGGVRVNKDCAKLESYGTIDELICLVGTARTVLDGSTVFGKGKTLPTSVGRELEVSLRQIQNRLFDVGSILATPAGESYPSMPKVTDQDVTLLEGQMDQMQKSLFPLTSFVLPGGHPANAILHQCRAVCRRAERLMVGLSREETVEPNLVKYINRLSDLFFVMSRYASKKAGAEEYLWEYGATKKKKPGSESKAQTKKETKPKSKKK